MKVHYGFENLGEIKNPVVTTGTFDGVHLGHQAIINRLNNLAQQIGGESVLITFHPHPRKILYPDTAGKQLKLISSQEEKIELLANAGLGHIIIVEFTMEFARISSIDFIRKILVEKLRAKKVIIGFNHHFGHNAEGDFEYLEQLGKYYNFEVEEIPEQDLQNETVSSTKIRKAIADGYIQRANAYLDHIYMIKGMLLKGDEALINKGFSCYRIEIFEDCKLLPPSATYAGHIIVNNEYVKCMCLIQNNNCSVIRDGERVFVDLILIEQNESQHLNTDARVYFHKKMSHWDTELNSENQKAQIETDLQLVDELIY